MLFNNGVNAGEEDYGQNLKLDITAYIRKDNNHAEHRKFFEQKLGDFQELVPNLLTASHKPMDVVSGEVPDIGDRAVFKFAAGKERLNLAYEGVYALLVVHGNLVLEVDAYVLREPRPWKPDELASATRNVAIGVMEGLRKK